MAWFRRRHAVAAPQAGPTPDEDVAHLVEWMRTRRGIEIYTEPKTSLNQPTMLLVAHDGEFTRRPVRSPVDAEKFARKHGLPIYDATVIGYPQRMRDYSRRQTLRDRRDRRP